MDLHEYKDVAENYDLYIGSLVGAAGFDNDTCIKFHMELARHYGSEGIVDIACGTGLILVSLVQQGYQVTGVDISQEMLNQTRLKLDCLPVPNKECTLLCSSMTDFKLDKPVSLAIIPRSGFMHLLNTSDQIAAMNQINANLVLGGTLSLNTYFPSYEIISKQGKGKAHEPFYRTSFVNKNNNTENIYNFVEYNFETQVIEGKWIFEEIDSGGKLLQLRERPVAMRWTFKSEMELLFKLCGFEVIDIFGGYDKSRAAYPGNIIWLVKKVR